MARAPDRGVSTPLKDWVVKTAQALLNRGPGVVAPNAPPEDRSAPPEQQLIRLGQPVTRWQGTEAVTAGREPWFGPGSPLRPQAPAADVAGRQWDYRAGVNTSTANRTNDGASVGISFEALRVLADRHDLVRLCIETRKDQMAKLGWSILPLQKAGQALRDKADERCRDLEASFRRPDRKNDWATWMRILLEEMFVLDAPAVYVRPTNAGKVYALEIVSGDTIKPLLDVSGRRPDAPAPAYQQVLKGMPAIDYTADELLYVPRNPRANKIYGMSVVEQIIMTVNIALRREVVKLNFFTEGNVPEAIVSVPKEWTPAQVEEFQGRWDVMTRSAADRSKMKFVPGQMSYQPVRSDAVLMGAFDEWLARVICFAFSLPPTAFVQQQNRATAEQAHDSALEEGLQPLMTWFKALMDRIIQQVFGYNDLEFVFDDVKQIDTAAERMRELSEVAAGIISIDEARAKRGMDPIGMDEPWFPGIGPMGGMFKSDLLAARDAGLLRMQPPPPPQQFDEYGNPLPPSMGVSGPPMDAGAPGGMPGAAGFGDPGMSGSAPPQAAAPAAAPPKPVGDVGMKVAPIGVAFDDDLGTPATDQARMTAQAAQAAAGQQPPRPAPRPINPTLAMIPLGILQAVGLAPGSGPRLAITRTEEMKADPERRLVPNAQVLATLRRAEAAAQRRGQM